MKSFKFTTLILLAGLTAFPVLAGDMTNVFYPTQAATEFTVQVPSDWKMIPQGEAGAEDYFEVEGPNGLELSFRSVEGTEIEKAVEAHIKYLKENFTDLKPGEMKETKINGMEAIILPATGKDKDGNERDIGAGWFKISDTKIGELWYNVKIDDKEGTAAAIKVLNSLSGPAK